MWINVKKPVPKPQSCFISYLNSFVNCYVISSRGQELLFDPTRECIWSGTLQCWGVLKGYINIHLAGIMISAQRRCIVISKMLTNKCHGMAYICYHHYTWPDHGMFSKNYLHFPTGSDQYTSPGIQYYHASKIK